MRMHGYEISRLKRVAALKGYTPVEEYINDCLAISRTIIKDGKEWIEWDHDSEADAQLRQKWSPKPMLGPPIRLSDAQKAAVNEFEKHEAKRAQTGPGDLMHLVFERMGIKSNPLRCPNGTMLVNCGCETFRQQMNGWGFIGCIWHLPEIVRWFATKAGLCGIAAGDLPGLIRAAIVGGE